MQPSLVQATAWSSIRLAVVARELMTGKHCKMKRNNPVNDARKWLDSLMYSSYVAGSVHFDLHQLGKFSDPGDRSEA
jgi:hypothetical protein